MDKLRRAAELHVGTHCLKNVVRITTAEPDPLGYIRTIDDIQITTAECQESQLLILAQYPDLKDVVVENLYIRIKARSFMWN